MITLLWIARKVVVSWGGVGTNIIKLNLEWDGGKTKRTSYISKRHVIYMFVVYTNLGLVCIFGPKIIPKLEVCFLKLVGMIF